MCATQATFRSLTFCLLIWSSAAKRSPWVVFPQCAQFFCCSPSATGFTGTDSFAATSVCGLNIQPRLTSMTTASTAAMPKAGALLTGSRVFAARRKGHTMAHRNASTAKVKRREKSGQKSQPASLTAQNNEAINAIPYSTMPLVRLVNIRMAAITITAPMIRKYRLPPTVASFKPSPPTARPMSIISPTRSHCRIRGNPRGALPNAMSISLNTPARLVCCAHLYQLGHAGRALCCFYRLNSVKFTRINSCANHLVNSRL